MLGAGAIDEERAELEVLNSNLRKTHELSTSMAKLLGGFDERLQRMEGSMKPLHRTTQRLNLVSRSGLCSIWKVLVLMRHIDVDAALSAIQKTKEFWTIPGEEEPIIRAG